MAEEVTLFGSWASPYSSRIKLALKLKGVEYQYIEEDTHNKSPALLNLNPVHKKVPVLVHNGKPIAESLVILEYIDEVWKNCSILPQDPYKRAMSRFWAKFIDETVVQSAWKLVLSKEEEKRQATEESWKLMKFLEDELKGKDFFGGETIGYLDIVAIPFANIFQVLQEVGEIGLINNEKHPVLYEWMGRLFDMDLVKQSLPPRDKHVPLVRAHVEATKSASTK